MKIESKSQQGEKDDVLIIGGGILGVGTALELRKRGHEVTLVDWLEEGGNLAPNPLSSSEDISKIVRADYSGDLVYVELCEQAILKWKEWNTYFPEKTFHQVGLLNLSRGKWQEGEFVHDSFNVLNKRGYHLTRLPSAQHIRDFCPKLNTKGDYFTDGYLNHEAGWIESGKILSFLLQEIKRLGVRIIHGKANSLLFHDSQELHSLSLSSSSSSSYGKQQQEESKKRVIGVQLDDGRKVFARQTVVACGGWTPLLVPWLKEVITPVAQPVLWFALTEKQQMEYSEKNNFLVLAADMEKSGFYMFPSHPKVKALKIGCHGTGIPLNQFPSITSSLLETLKSKTVKGEESKFREFLSECLPELANAPLVNYRLCLYSDTFDGHFFIDRDPQHSGLVVAAGGSGHLFKFGSVLGELVADIVQNKPNRFSQPFRWRTKPQQDQQNQSFTSTSHQPKEAGRAKTQSIPIDIAKY